MITGVVLASMLLAGSLALAVCGTAAALVDGLGRDQDGFLMSDRTSLLTSTFALASEAVELDTGGHDGFVPNGVLGDLLGQARISATADRSLFIGVAPSDDAAAYLARVEHDTVTGLGENVRYRTGGVGAPAAPPATEDIWAARTTGTGDVTLDWKVRDGGWTVVVMNADATAGVATEVAAGVTLPWLDNASVIMLVLGGVGLLASTALLVALLRNPSPEGERR